MSLVYLNNKSSTYYSGRKNDSTNRLFSSIFAGVCGLHWGIACGIDALSQGGIVFFKKNAIFDKLLGWSSLKGE
jgi:hypothetical protein